MPLSKFLMSLSQIILICNWLLEGDLKNKFSSFFKNKAALAVSSLLILHLFGLIYTSDFKYAFNDIRIKLPLLVLPLVLSTSKHLTMKIKELVLKFFIFSVVTGTIISTFILFDIIHRPIIDTRSASIFISHIRFALLICIAIFSSIYLIRESTERKVRFLYSGIVVWLLIFLVLIESITGISALAATAVLYLFYKIIKLQKPVLRYLFFTFFVLFVGGGSYMIYKIFSEEIKEDILNVATLEKYTAKGNLYHHEIESGLTENGHFIWIYYSENELKEAWNNRSNLDFYSNDMKGNVLRFTLVRYLTSKNLRKDAEGLSKLSDAEIKAIEMGVSNVNYLGITSLKGRLQEIKWEIQTYRKTGEASGHSITQRFEAWKAAGGIIADNLMFGVGTGDIQKAFDDQYEKTNSTLNKKSRLRSHNQYLSLTVAFGLFGLSCFLFSLFYPVWKLQRFSDFLYMTFFIVALFSFVTEDTLETQAGVTFFAFLNSFFLFSPKKRSDL